MDEFIEKLKKEGCENCSKFEKKEKLLQNDGSKIINKFNYCKLLKEELKNTLACDKFEASFKIIRNKMFKINI